MIPTLGLDLGTVLGVTPMSGLELGTELGVIPTVDLELGTELEIGAVTGTGSGSASSSVTVSTIGRFSGSTFRGQDRRREENPDWKQWKLHHQIQYHLLQADHQGNQESPRACVVQDHEYFWKYHQT